MTEHKNCDACHDGRHLHDIVKRVFRISGNFGHMESGGFDCIRWQSLFEADLTRRKVGLIPSLVKRTQRKYPSGAQFCPEKYDEGTNARLEDARSKIERSALSDDDLEVLNSLDVRVICRLINDLKAGYYVREGMLPSTVWSIPNIDANGTGLCADSIDILASNTKFVVWILRSAHELQDHLGEGVSAEELRSSWSPPVEIANTLALDVQCDSVCVHLTSTRRTVRAAESMQARGNNPEGITESEVLPTIATLVNMHSPTSGVGHWQKRPGDTSATVLRTVFQSTRHPVDNRGKLVPLTGTYGWKCEGTGEHPKRSGKVSEWLVDPEVVGVCTERLDPESVRQIAQKLADEGSDSGMLDYYHTYLRKVPVVSGKLSDNAFVVAPNPFEALLNDADTVNDLPTICWETYSEEGTYECDRSEDLSSDSSEVDEREDMRSVADTDGVVTGVTAECISDVFAELKLHNLQLAMDEHTTKPFDSKQNQEKVESHLQSDDDVC